MRRFCFAAVVGAVAVAGCTSSPAKHVTAPVVSASVAPSPTVTATASTTQTSPPPPPVVSDVTLAYFRPGLGVIGVTPRCCGYIGGAKPTLWLTTDMVHWHDATPAALHRGKSPGDWPIFEDATFLDARTGWVTTFDAGGDLAVSIYRTHDGGRTWNAEPGGEHSLHADTTALFDLLSPSLAYREVLEPVGPGYELSVTIDAGHTWTDVSGLGQGGGGPGVEPMTFANRWDGFAADGLPPFEPFGTTSSATFFATRDGGHSWVRLHPPLSAARRCPTSDNASTSCAFALPTFVGGVGVLAGAVRSKTDAVLSFDTSYDAGRTWRLTSTVTVPMPVTGLAFPYVSVASPSTWWVVTNRGRTVTTRVTTDAGRTWVTRPAMLLPGTPQQLTAIDAMHAWMLVEVPVRGGYTTDRVLGTTDGGRTWHVVTP